VRPAKGLKEGQGVALCRVGVVGAHAREFTNRLVCVNAVPRYRANATKNPADILAGLNGPYDGLRWRVVALVAGWRGGDGG
jgi:hypothetical protein